MRRIENQELAFADLQYIGFSSFSTIDSKRTEFGHLHNIIRFSFYCFLPQDHKSLMPMGGKIHASDFFSGKSPSFPTPFPLCTVECHAFHRCHLQFNVTSNKL